MIRLADRIETLEGSKTIALFSEVRRRLAAGQDVINFGVGEPAYETPEAVVGGTCTALEAGETRYGEVAGLGALRQQLARGFAGAGVDQVLVGNGSKQLLYSAFQILCNPGDEVLIPVPSWVSFAAQVRLSGARPVFIPTKGHQLDLGALAAGVTDRTRAIVINSPNNPTGAVYPFADLEHLGALVVDKGLTLISDEAYGYFTYDGLAAMSPYAIETLRDHLLVIRSFSKHHAMTGFRVGYAVGPRPLIAAMIRLQSHLCGNVCTFAQHGALAALQVPESIWGARRSELMAKRDWAYSRIRRHLPCIKPQGAFYLYPDIRACLAADEADTDFCARLLESARVAVVPGSAFGGGGHVRICYAVPQAQLEEGIGRMEQFL
ncbi:MAG: pyridoxal phosphate-dependent aminotransferase [Desulfosarcinaceae bacterium]|nr:pyridoxal phosphate-dependent aminotransferase [Desulfosarcinaceae bacterium]